MSNFNWPLFLVLAAMVAPVGILRIWLAVTFDKRVANANERSTTTWRRNAPLPLKQRNATA